jgi:hypothetical protein
VLDVLNKHLTTIPVICVVGQWIGELSQEEQDAFIELGNNDKVIVASLYKDLQKEIELPFKLTAFRSHLRGYCTCRN